MVSSCLSWGAVAVIEADVAAYPVLITKQRLPSGLGIASLHDNKPQLVNDSLASTSILHTQQVHLDAINCKSPAVAAAAAVRCQQWYAKYLHGSLYTSRPYMFR